MKTKTVKCPMCGSKAVVDNGEITAHVHPAFNSACSGEGMNANDARQGLRTG